MIEMMSERMVVSNGRRADERSFVPWSRHVPPRESLRKDPAEQGADDG